MNVNTLQQQQDEEEEEVHEYLAPRRHDESGETSITDTNSRKQPAITTSLGSERIVSLDAFRGLTIALMMLVNNSGGSYWWLEHAEWKGLTLADLVMPTFLFIVGASIAVAIGKALQKPDVTRRTRFSILWKAIVRTIKLLLLGLILQGGDLPFYDLSKLRIMGVLQRIAICYIVTVVVVLFVPVLNNVPPPHETSPRHHNYPNIGEEMSEEDSSASSPLARIKCLLCGTNGAFIVVVRYLFQWLFALALCILYLCLTYALYVPGCGRGHVTPQCNAAGYLDTVILTPEHMYPYPTCRSVGCTYFEPEGLLTTLGAISSCFYGLYFGYVILHYESHKQRLLHWIVPAVPLVVAGISLHFLGVPLNKNLYSWSYQLLMAGFAGLVGSFVYVMLDVLPEHGASGRVRRVLEILFTPFIVLGMNSIAVYAGDDFLQAIIGERNGSGFIYVYKRSNTLTNWLYNTLYVSWLPKEFAAAMFATTDVIFWMIVAYILYRKKIFFKV